MTTTLASLEARLRELEDIEAIKKLQHKYFRCIDSKNWKELAECFAEDAETRYDGFDPIQGKAAIMKHFYEGRLSNPHIISAHQFHNEEIERISPTAAKGKWHFSDYVVDTLANKTLVFGAGFHYDEYVKEAGKWKIKLASFQRIFQETWDRQDIKSLRMIKVMKFQS